MIFGKDRACGEVAKDPYNKFDAFDEQHQVDKSVGLSAENELTEEYSTANPSPMQVPPETPDGSTGQSMSALKQGKKTGKKRKAARETIGLIEMLGKMQDDTNQRLDTLNSRIGYEFDVSKSRKKVFDLVGAIPGISLLQQIDVTEIILDKVERIDLFMCLPEHARPTYVLRALEKHGVV